MILPQDVPTHVELSAKYSLRRSRPNIEIMVRWGGNTVVLSRGPSIRHRRSTFTAREFLRYFGQRHLEETARNLAFMFPQAPAFVTLSPGTRRKGYLALSDEHLNELTQLSAALIPQMGEGLHREPAKLFTFERMYRTRSGSFVDLRVLLEHSSMGYGLLPDQMDIRSHHFRGHMSEFDREQEIRVAAAKFRVMKTLRVPHLQLRALEMPAHRVLDLYIGVANAENAYRTLAGVARPIPPDLMHRF